MDLDVLDDNILPDSLLVGDIVESDGKHYEIAGPVEDDGDLISYSAIPLDETDEKDIVIFDPDELVTVYGHAYAE